MKKAFNKITRNITAAALILLLCFSFVGCAKISAFDKRVSNQINGDSEWQNLDSVVYDNSDGMSIIGKVPVPQVKLGEGELSSYPYPSTNIAKGNTISDATKVSDIKVENKKLIADIYAAYAADKDNGDNMYAQMFKHVAADYQLGIDADAMLNAERVVKEIIINNKRTHGPAVTGLYAPAGEVIKIELSEEAAKKGIIITFNVHTREITKSTLVRMPNIRLEFTLNKTVNYIGTPFGGGITFFNGNISAPTKMVISGAVESPYFRLGIDTLDDWKAVANSAGGVASFDTGNVLAYMPSEVTREIADPSAALRIWRSVNQIMDDAAAKSRQYRNKYNSNNLYFDSFVPAGAAVAFVEANFACYPTSWAGSFINADSGFVKNGGWGLVHEMGHNHQTGWGTDVKGEVTNNVLGAMSYILLTEVSASRNENSAPGGWNYVADAYYTLNTSKQVLANAELDDYSKLDHAGWLPFYVNLIHAFGAESFRQLSSSDVRRLKLKDDMPLDTPDRDDFFIRASIVFGYDLTEYARYYKLISNNENSIKNTALEYVKSLNLPMYYPLANLYAVGSKRGEKTVITERPFYINKGQVKTFDFTAYTADPLGKYTFKGVKGGKGTFKQLGSGKYEYTPTALATTVDSFVLEYECEDKSLVQLLCEVRQNINVAEAEIYNDLSEDGIPPINLDEAIARAATKAPDEKAYVAGMVAPNLSNKNFSYSVTKGKFVPSSGGTYKLFMRNDDFGALYIAEKSDFSDAKLLIKNNNNNGNYNKSPMARYIFVSGKEYFFKLAIYNKGGTSYGSIGYVIDNSVTESGGATTDDNFENEDGSVGIPNNEQLAINNIPVSNVVTVDEDYSKAAQLNFIPPTEEIFRMGLTPQDTVAKSLDKSGFKLISAPKTNGDTKLEDNAIFDGKNETYYHAIDNSSADPYPHVYTMDLGVETSFEYMDITGRAHQNPVIDNYSIYISNDNVSYNKVYDGNYPENSRLERAVFENRISTRYVRLVAHGNYGRQYTCLAEIDFGNLIEAPFITPSTSSKIAYGDNFRLRRNGTYVNGRAAYGKGSIRTDFYGSDLIIFGDKFLGGGTMIIEIDKKKVAEVNVSSDTKQYNEILFYTDCLADKPHKLKITSKKGEISFNYLTTKYNLNGIDQKYSYWSNLSFKVPNFKLTVYATTTQTIWFAVIATMGLLILIAILLFMLIFPFINKKFDKKLPCVDMFNREETEEDELPPIFKRKNGKSGAKSTTKSRSGQRTEIADASYNDDRYVKTIRIDKLYKPTSEENLTAAKIDQAVRDSLNINKDLTKEKTGDKPSSKAKQATSKVTAPKAKQATSKATAPKAKQATSKVTAPKATATKPSNKGAAVKTENIKSIKCETKPLPQRKTVVTNKVTESKNTIKPISKTPTKPTLTAEEIVAKRRSSLAKSKTENDKK